MHWLKSNSISIVSEKLEFSSKFPTQNTKLTLNILIQDSWPIFFVRLLFACLFLCSFVRRYLPACWQRTNLIFVAIACQLDGIRFKVANNLSIRYIPQTIERNCKISKYEMLSANINRFQSVIVFRFLSLHRFRIDIIWW